MHPRESCKRDKTLLTNYIYSAAGPADRYPFPGADVNDRIYRRHFDQILSPVALHLLRRSLDDDFNRGDSGGLAQEGGLHRQQRRDREERLIRRANHDKQSSKQQGTPHHQQGHQQHGHQAERTLERQHSGSQHQGASSELQRSDSGHQGTSLERQHSGSHDRTKSPPLSPEHDPYKTTGWRLKKTDDMKVLRPSKFGYQAAGPNKKVVLNRIDGCSGLFFCLPGKGMLGAHMTSFDTDEKSLKPVIERAKKAQREHPDTKAHSHIITCKVEGKKPEWLRVHKDPDYHGDIKKELQKHFGQDHKIESHTYPFNFFHSPGAWNFIGNPNDGTFKKVLIATENSGIRDPLEDLMKGLGLRQ